MNFSNQKTNQMKKFSLTKNMTYSSVDAWKTWFDEVKPSQGRGKN